MALLDGQAGQAAASAALPMGPSSAAAAERVYGLAVTGAGLVTYVDASFGVRSGMAAVEVVVDAVAGLPRGKALTGGVLGDVNGDGQVNLADALLVMTYVVNGSVELPANGDISWGDVNGDGQVNLVDALLVMTYVVNPADASLPAGIGQAVTSSGGDWIAGAIRRLTTDGGEYLSWSPDFDSGSIVQTNGGESPSWSPDGRHIAFVSERDGNDEIYVMGSDGSNPRRLTDHSDWDFYPSWSPDGRHIAFTSRRDGNGEIYVMGSDGSNRRRLTDNSAPDFYPSWSPDGRHIAFASRRDGDDEIYVMGSDGSNPRRLTDSTRPTTFIPHGHRMAGTSPSRPSALATIEIYVMGSDGSNPRRLTDNSAPDRYPSWSPDGRHIAFASDRDGNRNIYVMELGEDSGGGTPLDHGDSPATANPLAVGESIDGELSTDDIDYFRVTVSSAGRLIASTTGRTNTYGSIEDSSGNVLDMDNYSGGGGNFRVWAAVEPGTYYIRVSGSTGVYTLTIHLAEITPEIVGLYGTLVTTFTNIFFAALIPGTTSVLGEGGGTVEIVGNDWTLQDYSPDGALIINGTLNVGVDQTPIPLTGTVTFSGSQEAELILNMELSVGTDGLSATGTITINGAEFDVAELSAAAATAAAEATE